VPAAGRKESFLTGRAEPSGMPDRRDPPPTDEGWYALHDFRTVDWDAWRGASERDRARALEDGVDHLETTLSVEGEGASAVYSVLGHKADFLVVHLRPSTAEIGALERRFETTEFAEYTDRASSFVSVTEASGYSEQARSYFEEDLDEDSGLANYIRTRLEPTIPDVTHVCFYPMDKRREPEHNWYDLPFEERAEHMAAHGDIGRKYGGRVVQMITGAIALDDWEWGVTLWGDDLADMKDLLYEMRFDPSTSRYAEFGSFYVGRRFPPADLEALLAGDPVPTGDVADEGGEGRPTHPEEAVPDGHGDGGEAGGGDAVERVEEDSLAGRLATLGFDAGEDYEADGYGLVVSADAEASALVDEVDGLRGNFEHYDSHVLTAVRAHGGQAVVVSLWETERAADTAEGFLTDLPGVVRSVRGPFSAAEGSTGAGTDGRDADAGADGTDAATEPGDGTASIREELADLDVYAGQPHGEDVHALVLYSRAEPDVLAAEVEDLREGFDRYDTHEGTDVYTDPDGPTAAVVSLWETEEAAGTASGHLADLPGAVGWADAGEGFGTMGMFYTVKPEYREDFVEKFATVEDLLSGMDGHRETSLLINREDDDDMFIASRWDSKADAMAFFRSEEFSEAVDWGRDVLADRPRHVFLA